MDTLDTVGLDPVNTVGLNTAKTVGFGEGQDCGRDCWLRCETGSQAAPLAGIAKLQSNCKCKKPGVAAGPFSVDTGWDQRERSRRPRMKPAATAIPTAMAGFSRT